MGLSEQIEHALGDEMTPDVTLGVEGGGTLPSVFDVTALATASVAAAAREMAAFLGAPACVVDRDLACRWFDMTLQAQGWDIPAPWDPVAGDYRARDGWIRLHTNAPVHKAAALAVLRCSATRDDVEAVVSTWPADALEAAIVAAGGCAAAMRSPEAWAAHPQGAAVAREPLIAWHPREACGSGQGAVPRAGPIRVLDVTRILAGPVATRFLAAFGAEVLRIDPPGWREPSLEPEVTVGKRCAELDLKTASGRERFTRLLAQADVVVHGLRPGALEAVGLGQAARGRINPRLVDVSVCAYGTTGPWAGRRGFDSLVQMSCGIAHAGMARLNADRPRPLPVQALDHATGYLLAAAVLRGLRIRQSTGQGMVARLSLARTAAMLMQTDGTPSLGRQDVRMAGDARSVPEKTEWGPARRVAFPVRIEGHRASWRHVAAPLRRDPAKWPD